MGEAESGTLAGFKRHRKELIDPKIAEHKGRIVGSDQYLTKPFSKNELLGAIEAHVSHQAA